MEILSVVLTIPIRTETEDAEHLPRAIVDLILLQAASQEHIHTSRDRDTHSSALLSATQKSSPVTSNTYKTAQPPARVAEMNANPTINMATRSAKELEAAATLVSLFEPSSIVDAAVKQHNMPTRKDSFAETCATPLLDTIVFSSPPTGSPNRLPGLLGRSARAQLSPVSASRSPRVQTASGVHVGPSGPTATRSMSTTDRPS